MAATSDEVSVAKTWASVIYCVLSTRQDTIDKSYRGKNVMVKHIQ